MLEKDPAKRIKLACLLHHDWINEGYDAYLRLGEEGHEHVADFKTD